jgi:hypothetical protein
MLLKFFNPWLDWYEEAKFHLYKSKQIVKLACSAATHCHYFYAKHGRKTRRYP